MVKPLLEEKCGQSEPAVNQEVEPMPLTGQTPEDSSKRSKSSLYKYDLEERMRETLDRLSSRSFDDVIYLPSRISNARLLATLQCCFKRKRRFFQRTGKIRKLQVCLTRGDNLVIYKKRDKGLVLALSSVRKTSVSTQAFFLGSGKRIMVCRYRMVFDFGTLNLFFANENIPLWRDALDETIDKYSRSQYTLPFELSQATMTSHASLNDNISQNTETNQSPSTASCEDRSDRGERQTHTGTINSYRSLKISPASQATTSCKEDTINEHIKSVRRGKRSVASLRARIQRKFRGNSEKTLEEDEVPNPTVTVEEVKQDRLVPAMRRGLCTNDTPPPPLPANPPPSLSNSSPYVSSTVKMKETASSPIKFNPKPLDKASFLQPLQNSNDSDAFGSLRLTFSDSSEVQREVQPTSLRKVPASTVIAKPVLSSTPKCSPNPVFQATLAPKRPPRSSPLSIAEKSPISEKARPGILVTRSKRQSTAATMPPEKLDYPVKSAESITMKESPPPPCRLQRRCEAVRFSISSLPSGDEDASLSERARSARIEDTHADEAERFDLGTTPDAADSLVEDQDDEEWWQHSHVA